MNEQVLNIQFVQEVEKRPCLYNYNLTEYSRRDITDKAWSEVGTIVNLTGSQCKEKWKNLRAVFVRHMKQSGSSSKKRKPYYLTDAMQFTIPFIKVLSGISGNLADEQHEEIMEPEDNDELDATYMPSSVEYDPTSLANPPSQTSTLQNEETSIKKRKSSKSLTDYDKTVMDYFMLKNYAKKARIEKKAEDAMDSRKMFLLSLQHDVNTMSDVQMRTFRRKVLALIDEILDEPTH